MIRRLSNAPKMTSLFFSPPLPLTAATLRLQQQSLTQLRPSRSPLSTRLPPRATANIPDTSTATAEAGTEASTIPALFMCPNCKTILPHTVNDLPHRCPNCSKSFPRRDGYVDLTTEDSTRPSIAKFLAQLAPESMPQNLFRLPPIAYLYERGWRDQFRAAGFPGPEKELDLFLDFADAQPGEVALDLSCGSGILTRPLAKSGAFNRMIVLDYSDSMLRETVRRARMDVSVPELEIVRGNVFGLPFADDSLDVVHASAALHCYPKLQDALVEIYRVLKPGGRFFATTFFNPNYSRFEDGSVADRVSKWVERNEDVLPRAPSGSAIRFFRENELDWMLKVAGFEVEVDRVKAMAVVRARKN